jgi:hypothetical protein
MQDIIVPLGLVCDTELVQSKLMGIAHRCHEQFFHVVSGIDKRSEHAYNFIHITDSGIGTFPKQSTARINFDIDTVVELCFCSMRILSTHRGEKRSLEHGGNNSSDFDGA